MEFDVIIVGAGPAGSTAACYLGRMGRKVLLLDKEKFPRDKTCGDALSGKTLKVLDELGLESKIDKLPHAKLTGVLFSSPSGDCIRVKFPKNDVKGENDKGYCMRRICTDKMFFDAAKKTKNVKTIQKFLVQDVIFENDAVIGVRGIDLANKRKEMEFRAKVVIGSDGVNTVVGKKVLGDKFIVDERHTCDAIRVYYDGIKGLTDDMEIHFFDSCIPGYFWIFPIEDGKANVGLGLVSKDLKKIIRNKKKNIITLLNEAIENEPLIKDRFKDAKAEGKVTGWRLPFGSHRRKVAGDGWVLLGDAASLVDPFSGEGVGNATTSARIAAGVIDDALREEDLSALRLMEYQKRLWTELEDELELNYNLQRAGRIKFLLNRVIHKAATNDEIKEIISTSFVNDEAKKKFKSPLFYLKLLLT
jgi:menaquinone-9 beta-reductase